jgi:CHAD domain-containing protein
MHRTSTPAIPVNGAPGAGRTGRTTAVTIEPPARPHTRAHPPKGRIRRDIHVADEIVQTLNAVWSRYRRQLRRCQRHLSPETVHNLRVQTRRVLICLDLFEPVIGTSKQLAAARKSLSKRLAALGPLRDAHVQLNELEATLIDFPEMTSVQGRLRRREKRLSRSVAKALKKFGTSKLGRRIAVIRQELGGLLTDPQDVERLRAAYAHSAQEGLAALATARANRFRDGAKLHDARISLKHLRYGAEVLPASVGTIVPAQLHRLKKTVAALGRIHDIDVHLQRIAKLERKGRVAPRATASYRAQLARRRKGLASESVRLARLPASRGDKTGTASLTSAAADESRVDKAVVNV